MKLTEPRIRCRAVSLATRLPGMDRKRTLAEYQYRVTYRTGDPQEPGCILLWEVIGGRLPYQIALERTDAGTVCWHCTCADAIYRGSDSPDHQCKHVRGLMEALAEVQVPE